MNHMHHTDYMSDHCGCEKHEKIDSEYECREQDDCGYNDNDVEYETFGCQENGIPCPPPLPGSYMR